MGLRFFADQCVSNSIIQVMRDAGYEVLLLKDYIPTESSDAIIISKAQDLDAILVSLNGDFADIANYPPKQFKGIIALQVRNHPATHIQAERLPLITPRYEILCGEITIGRSP